MNRETIEYALAGVRAQLREHEEQGARLRVALQELEDALKEIEQSGDSKTVRRRIRKGTVGSLIVRELTLHPQATWQDLQRAVSEYLRTEVSRSTIMGNLTRLEADGAIHYYPASGKWRVTDALPPDELFEAEREDEQDEHESEEKGIENG